MGCMDDDFDSSGGRKCRRSSLALLRALEYELTERAETRKHAVSCDLLTVYLGSSHVTPTFIHGWLHGT
jgi:hypothetical protein